MSPYRYSSLPRPDSIRLLRLLPNTNETAGIHCQILNYPLLESNKGSHLYEALSYVWGNPEKTRPINIDQYSFYVTENLHAALLRLRDCSFERVIWVDAICINQKDDKEKENQIQFMARIYGQATRVIVWLGDVAQRGGCQALEEIRRAADNESTIFSKEGTNSESILKLLELMWFRRIWVLQEVAAARRILIMCGPTKINGYAFCSGLNKLGPSDRTHSNLVGLTRPVTYLIRGAIFRPEYSSNSSNGISLGELTDMYHTREATKRHDKIYALLGMSSEDTSAAGLSPNYQVPWSELLQRLVKFLLCEEVSVETWEEREIAVIKSKGCILGRVSSVENGGDRYDKQHLDIVFKNRPRSLEYEVEWGSRWTLQASAKPIQQGDLVCILQGTSKPAIIRACKDHFAVVMIAAIPQKGIQTKDVCVERQRFPLQTKSFPRDFLLVWNWERDLHVRATYTALTDIGTLVPEYSMTVPNKIASLYDVALILQDVEDYEESGKRLQEVTASYKGTLTEEHPYHLAYVESSAAISKRDGLLEKAEELLRQVIQTRKQMQGTEHPDTLGSIAHLASIYVDQRRFDAEKMKDLLSRLKHNVPIPEEGVVMVIRSGCKEVLELLLDLKKDAVLVSERVVKTAAGSWSDGKEIMTLLLDRRGDDIQITEAIVEAAAGNSGSGKEVMRLLLNRRGNDIQITEAIVKAAAGNMASGKEVMTLLLDRRGDDIKITEAIVKAAAGNSGSGKKVMRLLLNRRGDNIQITEAIVEAAAGNSGSGKEVMRLLLNRRGDDIQITEAIVEAAAGNGEDGKEVMTPVLN